jgi:CBS domain-containing protein
MAKRKRRSVGDLMNPNVVCVRPDMTVREAEQLLGERRVTGAPVVDEAGQPIGVISQHDLIVHQAERTTAGESGRFYTDVDDYRDIAGQPIDLSTTRISELMTQDVVSVERDASVAEAARLMRSRRIHRLLVTNQGLLVGIVSSLDLLEAVGEDEGASGL